MAKAFHATRFDGMTFGMSIDTNTQAWRRFKKAVKWEKAISLFGTPINVLTVPHGAVAAIMREAHWLVSEKKRINKFFIEGYEGGEEIFIKYSDAPIDFRTRRQEGGGERE